VSSFFAVKLDIFDSGSDTSTIRKGTTLEFFQDHFSKMVTGNLLVTHVSPFTATPRFHTHAKRLSPPAASFNAISGRRLNRGSFPSLIARRKVVQRSRAKDRAFISLQKGTPPRDPLPAYNASP